MPVRILTSVDLPAPFSPISAVTCPDRASGATSCSARTPGKLFDTPVSDRMGRASAPGAAGRSAQGRLARPPARRCSRARQRPSGVTPAESTDLASRGRSGRGDAAVGRDPGSRCACRDACRPRSPDSEDLGELLDVGLVEGEGLAHRRLAVRPDLGLALAAHLDRRAGPASPPARMPSMISVAE